MKAVVKGHLDGLAKELSSLIENSKPGSETALASWTKNSDDIDVALQVIGAVSGVNELFGRAVIGSALLSTTKANTTSYNNCDLTVNFD